jgi:hypothetical protein
LGRACREFEPPGEALTGRALSDVVAHYDDHFDLELSEEEAADLVEYLKSL